MPRFAIRPLAIVWALFCCAALASPAARAEIHHVRVPAEGRTAVAALEPAPARVLDYGAFVWLELEGVALRRLAAAGVPYVEVAEAGTVRVGPYRFDPLAAGEPELPPGLTAPADAPGLRLVQLIGPTAEGWLPRLAAAGVRVLQYYPHHTYLVWDGGHRGEALEALPFVRWQGPFHPAYKLGEHLAGKSGRIANVIALIYNQQPRLTLDALDALGGTVLYTAPAQGDGAFLEVALELDATALEDAARIPEVWGLDHRPPWPMLEDEMASQIVAGNHPGGVPVTGYFAHLASLGVDGSGVNWAIADTGVDYDHPDLGPRIVGGYSVPGTNCNPPGQPGSDCAGGGHGTHVAGITGGDASGGFTDGDGFLYGLGVAPGFDIFALNIFGNNVPLDEYSKRAFLGGAIGSNNSWTTGEGTAHGYQASERTYDFMVRDADFATAGVAEPHIVVFSAGNSGSGAMTLTAPKEAKNVIVTAGTQNYRTSSNIDAMYSSSSRGPAVDGRYVPTIAAPGQTIASARNDLGGSCANAIGDTEGLYAFCTGTSMASPHASGVAILIAQRWRQLHGGADPSPAMVKALLMNSAVDIAGAPPIPNFDEGWGRVQATEAVSPPARRETFDQTHTFDATGEQWQIRALVADPLLPVKISLVWSDAPGALGANPALVNDLDLTVDNGGNTYRGNVFALGFSIPGGLPDALNNLENVFLETHGPELTVTVTATAINGDGVPFSGDTTDQDFALACTNCRLVLFNDGFESGDTSGWSFSSGP